MDAVEGAPLVAAVVSQMARDALWRNRPPLKDDCDHKLALLPVIEFRQTVACFACGGLDVEASRDPAGCAAPLTAI